VSTRASSALQQPVCCRFWNSLNWARDAGAFPSILADMNHLVINSNCDNSNHTIHMVSLFGYWLKPSHRFRHLDVDTKPYWIIRSLSESIVTKTFRLLGKSFNVKSPGRSKRPSFRFPFYDSIVVITIHVKYGYISVMVRFL
jgi:hypothetical protein